MSLMNQENMVMMSRGTRMNDKQTIDSLFSAALALQKAGKNKETIGLLDEIIQTNPDFVDAYVLKGAVLQEVEDIKVAESAFRKALEIQPEHSEALQGLGLFLVSQERYEEALPYLRKHLEKIPDDSSSLDGILNAYLELPNHRREALDVLRHAWSYSQNTEIGLRYGRYLTFLGKDKEKVYEVFKEILEVAKTPKILSDFAFSCWFFDDYERAIDLLEESIDLNPSFTDALRLLADCYYMTDDLSKALENIEKAIALEPKDYRSWRLKTDIFIEKKEYDKALASAEKGIENLPKDEEELKSLSVSLSNPLFQKIKILFSTNRIDEGLKFAGVARELIPGNRHFYLYPAQKLSELGRPQEALDLLDSTDKPRLQRLFEPYRYRLLHQMGRAEEAWEYIFPKLQDSPDEKIDILAQVGVNFYSDGDRSSAMAIYEQLLTFQPDNPRLMNNYGYILMGEGEIDEAEALFIKVIQEDHSDVNTLISKCNLAYIFSIRNKIDQVFNLVNDILSSDVSNVSATLRVPFWFQGEIHPDPAQFPGREITLEMAALGCGVAVALAQENIEKADELNDALLVKDFEDPLPLICEGCVQAAKNNDEESIEAFTQAIEMSENKEEITILKNWVEILKNKQKST